MRLLTAITLVFTVMSSGCNGFHSNRTEPRDKTLFSGYVVDHNGDPVEGVAFVCCLSEKLTRPGPERQHSTDSAGRFQFELARSSKNGRYSTVWIHKNGFDLKMLDPELIPDKHVKNFKVLLTPASVNRFKIANSDGTAFRGEVLPNAVSWTQGKKDRMSALPMSLKKIMAAKPGEDGTWSMSGIGKHNLHFIELNSRHSARQIQVLNFEDADKFHQVNLQPTGNLAIHFAELPEELARSSAKLDIDPAVYNDTPFSEHHATIGLHESHTLHNVAEGLYRLDVALPEECDFLAVCDFASTFLEVAAGKTTEVDFLIQRAVRFKCQVLNAESGLPVPFASFVLSYPDRHSIWHFSSDANGIVQGKTLPGTTRIYSAHSSGDEFISADFEIVIPDEDEVELADIKLK